jgi:transposase
MADSILNFSYGILNWFDFNLTTSPLEGLNNKIKVMKRMGYEYKNMDLFKLRILGIHDTDIILTGT